MNYLLDLESELESELELKLGNCKKFVASVEA